MVRLNRIYITDLMIAESMYRRRKEVKFTTQDLMRMHWDRQGKTALDWARERIKRLRKKGLIENVELDAPPEGDNRMRYYGFTQAALAEWGLVPKT